eukprot:14736492-Heterocapsa_arctica.AAC.1
MSPTVTERNAPSPVGERRSLLSTVSLAQWSMPQFTPLKSFLFSNWASRWCSYCFRRKSRQTSRGWE